MTALENSMYLKGNSTVTEYYSGRRLKNDQECILYQNNKETLNHYQVQTIGRRKDCSSGKLIQNSGPMTKPNALMSRLFFPWILALHCLFASVNTESPALYVTDVSVNTANTGDTVTENNVVDVIISSKLSGHPDGYLWASKLGQSVEGIKVWSKTGALQAQISVVSSSSTFEAIVLKDPLKLFTGSYTGSVSMEYYTLATSTGTYPYAATLVARNTSSRSVRRACDSPDTTLIVAVIYNKIWKCNINTGAESTIVTISFGTSVVDLRYVESMDAYLVGYTTSIIPILRRSDFSTIKSPSFSSGNTPLTWTVDNLNTNNLTFAMYSNNDVYTFNISSGTFLWTTSLNNGQKNDILNFGPYQYIVTIPSRNNKCYINFMYKLTGALDGTNTLLQMNNYQYQEYTTAGMAEFSGDYYFGIVERGNDNFQTYKLFTGHCTERNTSDYCTTCEDGYYKKTIAASNICILPSQFNYAYGINWVTMAQQACSSTGCSNCTYNYTECVTCETNNSYYLNTTACVLYANFPAGYGVQSTLGWMVGCATPNCLNCHANYATCVTCNYTAGYYMNGTKCVHYADWTSGWGIDTTNNIWKACTESFCTNCTFAYGYCTGCDTANGYYLNGTTCRKQSQLVAGYGIDSVNGLIKPCSSMGCTSCAANYSVCSTCNTTDTYYLNGTECVQLSGIVSGYGRDTSNGTVKKCTATGCVNCTLDYSVCVGCDTTSTYYLNGTTCVAYVNISSGYGVDSTTGALKVCASTGCLDCTANYKTCITCSTVTKYYLNGTSCVPYTYIYDGWGIKSATGSLSACSITGCLYCKDDYQICTHCNVAGEYYLNGSTCVAASAIANGWGIVSSTGALAVCSVTGCSVCASSYLVCTTCNVAGGYYKNGTTCVATANILSGWGIDSSTGSLKTCSSTGCTNCAANYQICTTCSTSNNYYLNGTVCVAFTGIANGWGVNPSTKNIAACSDSNCLKCAADNTKCTSCDTTNNYWLNNSVCVASAGILAGWGIDSSTGYLKNCLSIGCIKCASVYSTCTECDTTSNYYLNGSVCVHSSNIEIGWGIDNSSGTLKTCTSTGCIDCKSAYSSCNVCDMSLTYYLNGTSCVLQTNFAAGWGADNSSGVVRQCSSGGCLDCYNDYLVCASCTTTGNYYRNGTTCVHFDDIVAGWGVDSATNSLKQCSDPECSQCYSDYQICTGCKQSNDYWLNNTSCVHRSQIVAGYGIDSSTGRITKCQSSGCIDCVAAYQTCTICDTANSYYLNSTVCMTPPNFNDHWGVDANTKSIRTCLDSNCVKCNWDYTLCTECDQANGYILVNGSCPIERKRIRVFTWPNTQKKETVDMSFILTAEITNTSAVTLIMNYLQNNLKPDIKFFTQSTKKQEDVGTNKLLLNAGTFLTLDVNILDILNATTYTMALTYELPENVTLDGKLYSFYVFPLNTTHVSTHYPAAAEEGDKYGQYIAVPAGLFASDESAVGWLSSGALMAADPTGTFFRFTKILQIVNKLYFININYGKRLEAFLSKSKQYAYQEFDAAQPQHVYNMENYRGKFTQNKVSLDFLASLPILVIFYLASWVAQLVKRLLLDNCIMGKVGIYFCHYANKVHLIIFNLVFIDFIWLAPRTLMHTRDFVMLKYEMTLLVLCLIAADLCLILAHLLDDRVWRKALEHYTILAKGQPRPVRNKIKPSNNKSESTILRKQGSQDIDTPNQVQKRQINYEKTYAEIDFNVHLMDMASIILRRDPVVYQSTLCRLLVLSIWWRVPFLGLIILSCQYKSATALTIMMLLEAARVLVTIYAYLKYKYLKNIICLLMEVSQSVFLSLFFFNALCISPKRFDEIIMDFYQDAGIWIVIASCVAEYLMLLIYIGVAAYEFWKNRQMMKKMNVVPVSYSVIKYGGADMWQRKPDKRSSFFSAGGSEKTKKTASTQQTEDPRIALWRYYRAKKFEMKMVVPESKEPKTILGQSRSQFSKGPQGLTASQLKFAESGLINRGMNRP